MAKEKAEQKYSDAIASGKGAYKANYDEDQQELLQMTIGNLQPKRSLRLQLSFLQNLEVFDKSWALSLSPTFAPSFCNAAALTIGEKSQSEIAPYSWEVNVEIIAHSQITRLLSYHHKVEPEYGEGRRTAKFSLKGNEPSPGFSLIFRSVDINEPKIYCQKSEKHGDERAYFISFFPDFCPPSESTSEDVDSNPEK